MPLEGIGPKWYCKQWHAGFFRRFIIFLPIAAFAGCDNIFPFVGTASAGG
jgi:hypothetical protein